MVVKIRPILRVGFYDFKTGNLINGKGESTTPNGGENKDGNTDDNNDKKEIKKLATDRQTIFMIVLALVFSPVVIGIRYCLFKLEKFKKIKILIESIGFVLFALYLRALKDMVAYMLIFLIFISYLSYRYYLLSLERGNDEKE